MFRSFILVVLLAVAGCATPAPDSDPYVTFARDYFELLQKRDLAAARAKFDPEIKSVPDYTDGDLELALAAVSVIVPSDQPLSSKVLANRSGDSAGVPARVVVIEYQFSTGPRRFELTMSKRRESIVVRFLRVRMEIEFNGDETEGT